MRGLRSIAYRLPVFGRVLTQRNEFRAANEALAVRVRELEAAADGVAKALSAVEAAHLEAVASYQQADAERWAAIRQREEAEAARWEAVRQREEADAARWEAVRQREEAAAARWAAVRQREAADAERATALPQRDDAEIARREAEAACKEGNAERAGGGRSMPLPQSQLAVIEWKDRPHLERQGLFVVGHARAGTSILLLALNTSPEVYLLGEPNLYQTGLRSRFAEWFNTMHEQFGNARAKDSYCPPAPDEEANGVQALDWLSRRYRYVGEKLAFRSVRFGYDPQKFLHFHAKYFGRSHYMCVIRKPRHVLKSNAEKFEGANLDLYCESYLANLSLIADMYELFPNTCVLTHERVNSKTFEVIAGRLDIDLSQAFSLYDHERFERGNLEDFEIPREAQLQAAYDMIAESFSPETLQIIHRSDLRKVQQRLLTMARDAGS